MTTPTPSRSDSEPAPLPPQAELGWEQTIRGDGTPVPNSYDIFDMGEVLAVAFNREVAKKIVDQCNSHHALVEALEKMVTFARTWEDDDRFRIMLAKSGAEEALSLARRKP